MMVDCIESFLRFFFYTNALFYVCFRGWSGGAKVLDKLSVPGRPTNLDNSRPRTYCACGGCGGSCFDSLSRLSSLSPSLWKTALYRLKYCLKGPLNSKQPTGQVDFIKFCLLLYAM